MTPTQIKVLIQSRNPLNRPATFYQLMYGEDIWGGKITPDVKIKGDVYLPQGSWASGKCILEDVKIPYNTNIISLSIHKDHDNVGQIGDYTLVKDYRVARGVYISGLIREQEYYELNARVIIGYELRIYGRKHLTLSAYKYIQKQKDKSK